MMKKYILLFIVLTLLLSGCMSNGQCAESISSVPSVESEAQTAEQSAQIAKITDVIKRYFAALENDDAQTLSELTNYRYALFGYEKGEDGGWTCPIKSYGNATAHNLKIEYHHSDEATEWSHASESFYVTYEIDKDNREYQNYLKSDPALLKCISTRKSTIFTNFLITAEMPHGTISAL